MKKMKSFFFCLELSIFLFLLLCIPLIAYSKFLLTKEVPLKKADWMIVLGGESSQRVLGAAELYHQGIAPNIFVTGSGDCRVIVRKLKLAGVPKDHIQYECASRSTLENSLYTKQYLQKYHIQSAILITNWYHSYRALLVFKKTWPEVKWGTYIVYSGSSLSDVRIFYDIENIFSEYVKIMYYWIFLI